jgi:purine nucleoside phosphorylase
MSVEELPESKRLDHPPGHHSQIPVHVGVIGGSGLYNLGNLTFVSVFFTLSDHT